MSNRIYGLDNWRALLLLAGPLVHACFHVGARFKDSWRLMENVAQISHAFRMETFFALAGFLAAHAAIRTPGRLFKRLLQLGLPMMVVWALVMYPLYSFIDPTVRFEAQHLWFLATLMIVETIFQIFPMNACRTLFDNRPFVTFALWVALVGLVRVSVPWLVVHYTSSSHGNWFLNALSLVPFYGMFFLIGFVAAGSLRLTRMLQDRRLLITALCLLSVHILFFNVYIYEIHASHGFLKAILLLSAAMVAALLCPAILGLALTTTNRSAILHRLSKSAYSVYLLHFPIIGFLAYVIRNLEINAFYELFLLFLAGFGVSQLFHELVIEKSPLASLLFNGRIGNLFASVRRTAPAR
jgi:glucan biosynthesis protein C